MAGILKLKNLARTALLALLAPLTVFAYMSPGAPRGFVNDFAGMFDPSGIEGLESKLSTYAQSSGNEIAVVAISSLGGDTVEDYAVRLFEEWGIGKEPQDNGALLLIARDERAVRIEVGYGLEPELTDLESAAVINNIIVPAFRDGEYAVGIGAAVDAMIEAIGGEYVPPTTRMPVDFDWFWLVFFVPVWLASILGRSKSWWAGGVVGGVAGVVLGFIFGFLWSGFVAVAVLTPLGLLFDFLVSRAYGRGKITGHFPWWIGGGPHGGRGGWGGGGFGGFGGGHSGGGGASGRW
ncbi:MAG: TPM domain-containing protein [Candidatus Brennerbacteria bacterium]|nr:TPM domain-containing protein [Candidatus Brennerbacteria bacterium]